MSKYKHYIVLNVPTPIQDLISGNEGWVAKSVGYGGVYHQGRERRARITRQEYNKFTAPVQCFEIFL